MNAKELQMPAEGKVIIFGLILAFITFITLILSISNYSHKQLEFTQEIERLKIENPPHSIAPYVPALDID